MFQSSPELQCSPLIRPQLLRRQINELVDDPEKLKLLPHNMTIYHRLMDADAYRNKTVPSSESLYEESQALMFGGADTVGNTLMLGTHHLLHQTIALQKLKSELRKVWPSLSENEPSTKDLENLPYLNAVIKESLRLSSGVTSGLLRMVPSTGATITGTAVPPGVCAFLIFNFTARIANHITGYCLVRKYIRSLQRHYLP
jgi:cytochrome P450